MVNSYLPNFFLPSWLPFYSWKNFLHCFQRQHADLVFFLLQWLIFPWFPPFSLPINCGTKKLVPLLSIYSHFLGEHFHYGAPLIVAQCQSLVFGCLLNICIWISNIHFKPNFSVYVFKSAASPGYLNSVNGNITHLIARVQNLRVILTFFFFYIPVANPSENPIGLPYKISRIQSLSSLILPTQPPSSSV